MNHPVPAVLPATSAAALGDAGSRTSRRKRSRKLHILTVAKYPLGGIRTYLKYTYGRFDPDKYRFTIAAMRGPESDLILGDLPGFQAELRETDEASGNRGILRLTREVLRQSQVDLIHSQGLTAGILAVLANWPSRRPHVITHHDVFRNDQFPGLAGRFKRRLMATVLSRADLIVCVTEDSRRNLLEFLPWFPSKKLTVVPNGIETASFAEVADRRQHAFGTRRPDAPFAFGFLGRFMPQKGFDVLVDAVAELSRNGSVARPLRVLAVNSGDCIGRCKREVRRQGLDSFVEFQSFRSSITDLLADLDCVVMPSRWEAAGLLAMEAMAAGCPVIASDCIGLREVVRDTPALVARAEDPRSLAEQMKRAMNHETEFRALFCGFAAIARNRFDVRRTAGGMEQIFSRFIPIGE